MTERERHMIVKRYVGIEPTDNGYMIHTDTADIMLVFMTDDIIRIRVSFDGRFEEASYALVTTAWEDSLDQLFAEERKRIHAKKVECEENENELVFQTETLVLKLRKDPLGFILQDKDGQIIYEDLKSRAFEIDQLGRRTHYSKIEYGKDHFYGFGEESGHIDKAGRHMRMCPKDAIGLDPENGDPMYKLIPFYIRINEELLHAVGLFYNNSYDCAFDMGNERSGYWDSYCYYKTEGGDIDLFLINGPRIADVISRYTMLTGTTAMPTKQSLGYTASTMYYAELDENCDQEIYKVIEKHKQENIYVDNFWLASGYSSGEEDNLRYTFNWNRKRFPDPEGFFDKMNEMGINVIPNTKPGILQNHPYRHVFEENHAFIRQADSDEAYVGRWWGGPGRFVDFTSKAGRDTWKHLLEENILKKGTKTVWNDNCEFDGVEDRNARCDKEGLGGTMAELKIIQSNMMAYMAKEAIRDVYPEERPYIISRAGYAGIQRYAQVWAGDNLTDWKTLKFNVATILGMGMSGAANNGCDIGGFAGPAPEEELLLRWIQNGIFQPRFCINSANSDNTVTQPWMYENVVDHVREAFAQRYRMLPYLYSLMREAHRDGMPAMRPLFLEFPDDRNTYSDKNLTFMFGPSVLVANVLEKGEEFREIYLPAGSRWYDLGDNLREYAGGQTIFLPVDQSSIPMFLRDSAVYITSEDVHHILSDQIRTLDILVSAAHDVSFVYYDDDGHSREYEKGICAETQISVTSGDRVAIRFEKHGAYQGTWEKTNLRVVNKEKGAYWVTVDGRKIKSFLTIEDYDEAEEGWYYNLTDRTVMVKYAKPEKDDFSVVVSFEKFDLIGMENNG